MYLFYQLFELGQVFSQMLNLVMQVSSCYELAVDLIDYYFTESFRFVKSFSNKDDIGADTSAVTESYVQ